MVISSTKSTCAHIYTHAVHTYTHAHHTPDTHTRHRHTHQTHPPDTHTPHTHTRHTHHTHPHTQVQFPIVPTAYEHATEEDLNIKANDDMLTFAKFTAYI